MRYFLVLLIIAYATVGNAAQPTAVVLGNGSVSSVVMADPLVDQIKGAVLVAAPKTVSSNSTYSDVTKTFTNPVRTITIGTISGGKSTISQVMIGGAVSDTVAAATKDVMP